MRHRSPWSSNGCEFTLKLDPPRVWNLKDSGFINPRTRQTVNSTRCVLSDLKRGQEMLATARTRANPIEQPTVGLVVLMEMDGVVGAMDSHF